MANNVKRNVKTAKCNLVFSLIWKTGKNLQKKKSFWTSEIFINILRYLKIFDGLGIIVGKSKNGYN